MQSAGRPFEEQSAGAPRIRIFSTVALISVVDTLSGVIIIKEAMGRQAIYSEEERVARRRAAWQKYNKSHKLERAEHNRWYVQLEHVKLKRQQRRAVARRGLSGLGAEDGGSCVGHTTFNIDDI